MFDELDPQDPPVFGADAVSAVRTKARRMRRRKQAVTGVAASGACAALVGTGLAVRWGGAFNRIDKVTVAAADPKADSLDRPMNILVVGWDTRSAEEQKRESVSGTRADVIRLVRFDPANESVTVLVIPRDLAFVDRSGITSRMSAAGNLDEAAEAVERIGLPVDHAIGIDMEGFAQVVDSLGGLRLRLELSRIQHPWKGATIVDRLVGLRENVVEFGPPIADPSGLDITAKSECRNWSGSEILAVARSRHGEIDFLGDASQPVTDGDFGREARETEIATAIENKVLASGFDLNTLDSLLGAAGDHVERDPGLGAGLLFQLGRHLADHPVVTHLNIYTAEAVLPSGAIVRTAAGPFPENTRSWKLFGSLSGLTSLDLPVEPPGSTQESSIYYMSPTLSAVPC